MPLGTAPRRGAATGSGKHGENAGLAAAPFLPAVPKYAQRSSPLKGRALLLPCPAGRVVLQKAVQAQAASAGLPRIPTGVSRKAERSPLSSPVEI